MIPDIRPVVCQAATTHFLQGLRGLVPIDPEAVVVFLEVHEEYHAKKINLEKALASCGMILLVRTFTLLQQFVALPRDDSSEAHYRLALREREDDGVQIIDVHYRDGTVSAVVLERALPGGGIYEKADFEMEDVFGSDSDSDSVVDSESEESGTLPPLSQGDVHITAFEDFLRNPHRPLDWDSRFREGTRNDATSGAKDLGAANPELRTASCGSGTDLDARTSPDEASRDSDTQVMQVTQQRYAKLVRRTCSGLMVPPKIRPPPMRPLANRPPWHPPVIASSSPPVSCLTMQRRDSLFDEDPADTARGSTPRSPVFDIHGEPQT